MKSKKQAVSILTALALLLGALHPGLIPTAQAAGTDASMVAAYAKVLQDIVNQYGICTADPSEEDYLHPDIGYEGIADSYKGLAYADLIDFDKNGVSELYLYYIDFYNNGDVTYADINEQVWKWNGNSAEEVKFEDDEYVLGQRRYIKEFDGKTCIVGFSYSPAHGLNNQQLSLYEIKGNLISKYQEIDETVDWIRGFDIEKSETLYCSLEINGNTLYDEYPISEEDFYNSTDYIDGPFDPHYALSTFQESKDFYKKYNIGNTEPLFFDGSSYGESPYWKTNNPSNLLAQLQERSMEGLSSSEVMSKVAYVGDPSKCKMDAKMANAYADVIESLPTTKTSNGSIYTLGVCLADLADDGYPIMITKYESSYDYWIMGTKFWEYRSGKVQEVGLGDTDNIHYGKMNGAGLLYSGDIMQTIEGAGHMRYYSISHGQINLVHSITQYGAIRTGESNAFYFYGELPGGETYQQPDGTIRKEDLEKHGWMTGDNNTWFLVWDGNRNVTQQCWDGEWVDIDKYTNAQIEGEIVSEFDGFSLNTSTRDMMLKALRIYADGITGYPGLTLVTAEDDPNVADILKAIASEYPGEVTGVYKLTSNIYYVLITTEQGTQGLLVKGIKQDGKIVWKVERQDATPADEDTLEAQALEYESKPNMSLDFSTIPGFDGIDAAIDYIQDLLDNVDGIEPNDGAKTELAVFIENIISHLNALSVSSRNNRLTVDAETAKGLAEQAQQNLEKIMSMLDENGVKLNKEIVVTIRLFWQDMDWSEPCEVTLDASLVEALKGCTVCLLLSDNQHYIQISSEQLKALVDAYNVIKVQVSSTEENVYTVNFLKGEGDGEIIEQLPVPVTIGLPASSMTSTIMASYAGGTENWGGQYDEAAQVISFETRYSGQYEVIENDIQIDDIGDLSEESQRAIRFLVSKGFMSLDGTNFDPQGNLNRYQFTQALVGMFYAMDHELTTSFKDVPEDSEFYDCVASTEEREIVEGIGNDLFDGESNTTMEQMLTIAARTLTDHKGYTLPDDTDQYLTAFADYPDISGWATQQIALAVREGLIDRGGSLLPQSEITREQAAVILYRLFLLLYEVSPVALELPPLAETAGGLSPVVIGVVCGAVVLGAGGGFGAWYYLTKKKKETKD